MKPAIDNVKALEAAWRLMTLIRAFEDALSGAKAVGEIAGFIHLATGQEAIAAAVHRQLGDGDHVASTHRCHAHALAAGCDIAATAREIFGRAGGLSGGRGGSQHLVDLDRGFLGGNGIVGAGLGLAAGAALIARTTGTSGVGVAFIGDGAVQQGVVHEVLNLAALLDLPLVTVIENNGWAQSTPLDRSAANPDLAGRAAAIGLAAEAVDGTDFFALDTAVSTAFDRARNTGRPGVIEARLARPGGHYAGDPQNYRDRGADEATARDCLTVFRSKAADHVGTEALDRIAAESAEAARGAVEVARRSPWPGPAEAVR